MTIQETLDLVLEQSISDFFKMEAEAILDQVSERNNCQRFSIYLERRAHDAGLTGYRADAEYNRQSGGNRKRILIGNAEEAFIHSDLILHSRGSIPDQDNLIAIEMKKADRPDHEKQSDRRRLCAMTGPADKALDEQQTVRPYVCGYLIGMYIELDAHQGIANIERYENGKQAQVYSIQLAAP